MALLAPTDFPNLQALADVGADMLRKIGMDVDYQAMDAGTIGNRQTKEDKVANGGWSVFSTFVAGTDVATPAAYQLIRANGEATWFGWPTDVRLESLCDAWFTAPGVEQQQAITRDIQAEIFQSVPFVPLGQYFPPIARRYVGCSTGLRRSGTCRWRCRAMSSHCLRFIDREVEIILKPAGMPSRSLLGPILAALKGPSAPIRCPPTNSNPARPT